MYVCICNSVTDHDIAEAVHYGARTLEDLEIRLGVGTCCGQCRGKASVCLGKALLAEGVHPVQIIQPVHIVPPAAREHALALGA